MKKSVLILFFFLSIPSFAQKQANNWLFGTNAVIDFNSGAPIAGIGNMSAVEGCAVISDTSGQLLFYSDGMTVWNNQHNQLPNGSGLNGGFASQPALFVPNPADTNLIYLFTIDEISDTGGLQYSIIDRRLDGNLGDISQKNIPLARHVTEKMNAVKHSNGTDVWVMVHDWGNDAFRAFLVTASGVGPSSIISHTGIVHDSSVIQNAFGQMKFSSCGTRVAVAVDYQDTVEVFDFNSTTGIVSNPMTIPMTNHVYGVEFSSDNSKLYVSMYGTLQTLFQFDLSSSNLPVILASKTPLTIASDLYDLQMGPDGKIYVSKSFSQFLGVINDPDIPGAFCDFVEMGLDLDPTFSGITSALGLPNFIQSYFIRGNNCQLTSVPSIDQQHFFSISPNPSNGPISISFQQPGTSLIKVFDATGRCLLQEYSMMENYELNLTTGMYFVSVSKEEWGMTKKVVVF